MKLLVVFIFCFLTPLIVEAGETYSSNEYKNYNCICVDSLFCDYKFNPKIRPRSLRQECNIGNQVCCKPEHITQFPNQNLSPPSNYNPNTPSCGRINPPPNNYGRVVKPNIQAALGEIPWQVAILKNSSVTNSYSNDYSNGYSKGHSKDVSFFISSGVLLNQNTILTTAHTLTGLFAKQIFARLGENNFNSDPYRKYPALNGRIKSITISPDFDRNTLENDVAVLCLNSPVKLSRTINSICLPDPSDFIGDTSKCVVSGWGKDRFYNGNYSTTLRKAYQNLVPYDICNDILKNRVQDSEYVLPQTFVCANGNYEKKDATCTGDAGSPLTCTNKDGQRVLVGLSSWGINCNEPYIPGVYVNVRDQSIIEFIKKQAEKCSSKTFPSLSSEGVSSNSDYSLVKYNSHNYNNQKQEQNYNEQSDYNQMNNQNYNDQLDYNPLNNNYNEVNNNYNEVNDKYNLNPLSDHPNEYVGRSVDSDSVQSEVVAEK